MLSKITILLYVAATAAALVIMKIGLSSGPPVTYSGSKLHLAITPLFALGCFLYVISFILYTFLISKYDLGYIIPLGTAMVYIVIFVLSFIIFKESFTTLKIIAISFIIVGVILLNLKVKL